MPPKRPPAEPPAGTDLRERLLFGALDIDRDGVVSREEFLAALWRSGLKESDPRLATVLRALKRSSDRLHYEAFRGAIEQSVRIVEQVIQGRTAIPDFEGFSKDIEALFEEARGHDEGTVAAYIPQLARANPEGWGLSLCTVDGQRLQLGDSTARFTAQSTSKPMNYALALEERGSEEVHRYVGREPSGHGFNELKLNREGRPHNPMINAGAIMTCALVRPDLSPSDRFDWLLGRWSQACGGARVGFDNAVYLSERETADRNFALAYFMREHKAFPPGTPLVPTLEFYFQCCSIEVDCEALSILAATLANGGVCPLTGEVVFKPETVRDVLSLMHSCGMYDFSGEFAFTIGLPAKSGVSGGIFVVIPGVMGFATWSPKVDRHGNSVRGVAFNRALGARYNFHLFDNLMGLSGKVDPRRATVRSLLPADLPWAAARGDLRTLQQAVARGMDLGSPDYDGRTALHLAAAEGRAECVALLLAHGVDPAPKDRWGHTPLEEARSGGHAPVVALLGG